MISFIYRAIDDNKYVAGVQKFPAALTSVLPLDRGEGNESLVLPFKCIPTVRRTAHERT